MNGVGQRPVPCRGFDCEDNEKWKVWKVWKDFEEIVFNEELIGHIEESEGI